MLHSLNSLLLMPTAKPAKLMVEKVVLHGLLFVLRMLAEHACSHGLPCNVEVVLLNSLLLNLQVLYLGHHHRMLTAKPAKLIAEKAVPHRLLLMLGMLTTKPAKLIVEKVVPHSLLLVFQMLAANASSQQNSSKGIGGWHVWHTLKFPPSQNGVQ